MKEKFLQDLVLRFHDVCMQRGIHFNYFTKVDKEQEIYDNIFNFKKMLEIKSSDINEFVAEKYKESGKNVIFVFDVNDYNGCYVLEELEKAIDSLFEEKNTEFIENSDIYYIDNLELFNKIVKPALINNQPYKDIFKTYDKVLPSIVVLNKDSVGNWDINIAAETTFYFLKEDMILDFIDELVWKI